MEKLEERGAKREEREKTVIQGAAVMYAERVESTSNTQQNENEAESHGQFDGRAGETRICTGRRMQLISPGRRRRERERSREKRVRGGRERAGFVVLACFCALRLNAGEAA